MKQSSLRWILAVLALLFKIGSIDGFVQLRTKSVLSKGQGFHLDNPSETFPRRCDTKLFCVDSVTQRSGKQVDHDGARARYRFQKRQRSRLFSSLTYNEAFAFVGSRQQRKTNLVAIAFCLVIACTSSKAMFSTAGTALSKIQQALVWYATMLELFPIVTKSVSAGLIGAAGDFMAQRMEHGVLFPSRRINPNSLPSTFKHPHSSLPKRILDWFSIGGLYDGRRGLSIAFDGLFVSGPLMHIGYNLFERVLPVSGGGTVAALAHVMADTLLLDSVFVATTIWVTGLFEGYSFKELFSQFRRDYVPTLRAGGLTSFLVLPLELVCFRFLPVSFRVLAVNFIDIIWDAVVSHFAHKNRHHEDPSAPVSPFPSNDSSKPLEQTTSFQVEVLLPSKVVLGKELENPPVGVKPSPYEDYLVPTVGTRNMRNQVNR